MSNKNQPHHKFVQTFVLAEQPNGYFVLNDIFRYLNEDEDEIVDDEPTQPEVPAEKPPTPVDNSAAADTFDTVATEDAVEKLDEELEEVKEEETADVEDVKDVPEPADEVDDVPAAIAEEPTKEVPEESAPAEPVAQEGSVESSVAQSTPPKAATPTPEVPPAKKTWASMLGAKAPIAPAVPSQTPAAAPSTQPKAPRPVQQSQPAKSTPTEAATNTTAAAAQGNGGWQMADGKKGKSGPQGKAAEGNVLAYIKNVNEKVDARTLREVLERYGELKYFDVSRGRVSLLPNGKPAPSNNAQNCAFVEFATPEGYAAAVAANPHTVGTETISVEERRPRPGAYGGNQGSFGRGNGMVGRGGRGNSQSGGFPKDVGRGGFQQQRGSKSGSGNVTPKGRAQAA